MEFDEMEWHILNFQQCGTNNKQKGMVHLELLAM
jgi:hypothetical protein